MLIAKNEKGQIVQEASTPIQDLNIYQQFFNYQSSGIPTDSITHQDVKNHLTGVSFLTKRNVDTISQVSDLLAYGLRMEVLHLKRDKKISSMNTYQKMIRGCAKSKLFVFPTGVKNAEKSRLYKKIEGLKIIC
ncbi:hypothetical protein KKC62_01840 [Patescibacteria group bacterium]|nr:hypothetical protein [Patescibacteria group bacterium]MBU1952924.1 hypothetical protein [Patescibacteria group bacterium]